MPQILESPTPPPPCTEKPFTERTSGIFFFFFFDVSRITLFLSWTRSSHPTGDLVQNLPIVQGSCPTSCLSSKISPAQPPFSCPNNQFFPIRLPRTPLAGASRLAKSMNSRTSSSPSSMTTLVAIPERPQSRTDLQSKLSRNVDSSII